MTWYAPTARLYVGRPALRNPAGSPGYPGWVMNALGGIPAAIDPTIVSAGKTVAGTFLDLLDSPETIAAARSEFDERRSGDDAMDPLLPVDFTAPTDLPWPEADEPEKELYA